jgi:heme-degrading monooxygenase HmoA
MSTVVLTYTLPSGAELLKQYPPKVRGWIDMALSAPGAREFRAYRSTDGKEVMTLTEQESVASAEKYLASDKYKTLRKEMEKAGCSNFHVRTWDTSPLVVQPVRAPAVAA